MGDYDRIWGYLDLGSGCESIIDKFIESASLPWKKVDDTTIQVYFYNKGGHLDVDIDTLLNMLEMCGKEIKIHGVLFDVLEEFKPIGNVYIFKGDQVRKADFNEISHMFFPGGDLEGKGFMSIEDFRKKG